MDEDLKGSIDKKTSAKESSAKDSSDNLIPFILLLPLSIALIFGTYKYSFIGAAFVLAPLWASSVQYFINTKIYAKQGTTADKPIKSEFENKSILPDVGVAVFLTVAVYAVQFLSSITTAKLFCGNSFNNSKSLGILAQFNIVPFASYVILVVLQIVLLYQQKYIHLLNTLKNIYFVFFVIMAASACAVYGYLQNLPCLVKSENQKDLIKLNFTERFGDKEIDVTVYEKSL